jgi:hypothetical protein
VSNQPYARDIPGFGLLSSIKMVEGENTYQLQLQLADYIADSTMRRHAIRKSLFRVIGHRYAYERWHYVGMMPSNEIFIQRYLRHGLYNPEYWFDLTAERLNCAWSLYSSEVAFDSILSDYGYDSLARRTEIDKFLMHRVSVEASQLAELAFDTQGML